MDERLAVSDMAPPLLDALAEICHLTTALAEMPASPEEREARAMLAAACARATLQLGDALDARLADAIVRARVLEAVRAARAVLGEAERAVLAARPAPAAAGAAAPS